MPIRSITALSFSSSSFENLWRFDCFDAELDEKEQMGTASGIGNINWCPNALKKFSTIQKSGKNCVKRDPVGEWMESG